MNLIQVGCEMTGGGIMTYWGLLDDGRYYVFSTLGSFAFGNSDYGYTFTIPFYNKTGGDCYEWEKKHYKVRFDENEGYPNEVKEIIEKTLERVGR